MYDKLISGILGLGFDTISVQHVTPPFYNLVNQHLIDEPLFAVWLGNNDGGQGGEITFGGVDSAHFSGKIHWAPVIQKGYWLVELASVTLGGSVLGGGSRKAAMFVSSIIQRYWFFLDCSPKRGSRVYQCSYRRQKELVRAVHC